MPRDNVFTVWMDFSGRRAGRAHTHTYTQFQPNTMTSFPYLRSSCDAAVIPEILLHKLHMSTVPNYRGIFFLKLKKSCFIKKNHMILPKV